MNVEARFGEDHVVVAFFSERRSEPNIEFVGLAKSRAGVRVVAQRVARLDALNQGAKDGIQMRDILHVEELAARLVHHFANVDQAGNHAGGKERLRRVVAGYFEIVEGRIRGDGLGDDVMRSLSAGVRANIVADQNDHAAALGRQLKQVLGGDEDSIIDIGGASGVKSIDLLGDFALVLREGDAQLCFGGKGKERGLVVGFESGKSGGGSVTQGAEKWPNRIAEIQD